ncbi:L,D-transpeptidase family protein [Streptomyces sp. 142MFCol3.1]|uniref:L,D-transpeptidase family protein n=1 Tax=Streptomyces sp. 142MFCol3.1 TaxID=1172179 RepID=UPI003B641ED6
MTSSTHRPSRRAPLPAPPDEPPAGSRGGRRPHRLFIPGTVLALTVNLAGCSGAGTTDAVRPAALEAHAATAGPGTRQPMPLHGDGSGEAPTASVPAQLPGLGPHTLARIPAGTRQVVLVTGEAKNSSVAQAVLYERTGAGWEPGPTWPAHNALRGWTDDHHMDDLHSPIGVFSLTDAGGRLADPGTKLPYHHSPAFTAGGLGFRGESLTGTFDYVVAINYNRLTGTSPLDGTHPQGAGKGGYIWLHVDHGGPTHGCVSLRRKNMRALLRALEPARHPVIVMGDASSLSR